MTDFPAHIKSVCVYCGSSARVADVYKDATRELARFLAKNGIKVVYGGGRVGLMGLLADTVIEEKGYVVGVIPEYLVYKELQHDFLNENHVVDSMHTRKKMMVDKADAFVILPGGFGTLDEAFEIMTWRQLGMHEKPVVFMNVNDYWNPLFDVVDKISSEGFSGAESKNLFSVASSTQDLVEALLKAPTSPLDPRTKWM